MSRSLLRPDLELDRLLDLPVDRLRADGVRGIIFDLDNTIIAWDSKDVREDVAAWLSTVGREMKLCIVSNSVERRVERIAAHLGVPYVARALKPLNAGFDAALRVLALERGQVAVVGDQLFTDVLGGNRIGAYTVLVRPMGQREFIVTRLTRILERWALKRRQ